MVPVGSVLPYAGELNNDSRSRLRAEGFLFCDGQEYAASDYSELYAVIKNFYGKPQGSKNFRVPDYRGVFLRGTDGGRGCDPDRTKRGTHIPSSNIGNTGDAVGSLQRESFKSHKHFVGRVHWRSFSGAAGSDSPIKTRQQYDNDAYHYTDSVGENETRPINVYVNYIICFESFLSSEMPPIVHDFSRYSLIVQSLEYGTTSPELFSDALGLIDLASATVSKVVLRGKGILDSISFCYEGSLIHQIGGQGGNLSELTLSPGEYVKEISGWYNVNWSGIHTLSHITVTTTQGRTLGSVGTSTSNGTPFKLGTPGFKIVGLFGSAKRVPGEDPGGHVQSLGAYYAKL